MGPIPWGWLTEAGNQPGRAIHVGIALWHLSFIESDRTIALSGKVLNELGVDRSAGYRALTALEKAGLVSVQRHPGRNPVVTILDFRREEQTQAEVAGAGESINEDQSI